MSFIETERLLLRTWMLPGDLNDAVELFTNDASQRWYIRGSLDADGVAPYVRALQAKEEREGFGVWPAVEKSTRELVGASGLTRVADLDGAVEIDWIVKPAARGKGYAKEAARAVLSYAFAQLRLRSVCALVDPGNSPSIAIANDLGMRFDRIVRAYKRDLMRYVKEAP